MLVSQSGLQTQNCDDAVSTASSGFACNEKTIKAVCEQKVSYNLIGNRLVFIVIIFLSMFAWKWHSLRFKKLFFHFVCHFKNLEGLSI